jgi:thiamine phosphate synthase YjbQ (UPF0047 family)
MAIITKNITVSSKGENDMIDITQSTSKAVQETDPNGLIISCRLKKNL